MRRILVMLVGTLVLPLGVGLTVPAQADTPGCVSTKEYRAAKEGMTPRRVARIFDTEGEFLDGGAGGYAQGYRRCGGGGVIIEYGWIEDSDRVGLGNKSQVDQAVVNCVTKDEWRQVYINPDGSGSGPGDGGNMRKVHRIFGTEGWFVNQFGDPHDKWQIRKYKRCGSAKKRTVVYHKRGSAAWWSYWG